MQDNSNRIALQNLLKQLNAEDKGDYYLVDCPQCKLHEAFIYKNEAIGKTYIKCNRQDKCKAEIHVLSYMKDKGLIQTEYKKGNDKEKGKNDFHVRIISSTISKDERYTRINSERNKNEEITEYICELIRKELNKSYSIETLKKANVKVFKYFNNYAFGLDVSKGLNIRHNNDKNVNLYVEGFTDYLTLIELELYKSFNLVFVFNKTKNLILDEKIKTHIFILDKDDQDIERKLKSIKNSNLHEFKLKFLTLPYNEKVKDISDLFNNHYATNKSKCVEHINRIYRETDFYKTEFKFWTFNFEKNSVEIDRYNLLKFLECKGFGTYNVNEKDFIFIRRNNGVVQEVTIKDIKDFIREYLEKINKIDVWAKLNKGYNVYFSKQNLEWFKPLNLEFFSDDKETSFIFYNNGIVKATKDGIKLMPYASDEKVIWKSEKLNRDFLEKKDKGVFEIFIEKVSQKNGKYNESRKRRLMSLLGYGLHKYKNPSQAKFVVLLDSKIVEEGEAGGGTGKSLIVDALGELRKTVKLDARNFKFDHVFCFQNVNLDTCIINLDDMRHKFPIDLMFSRITGDFEIERKNQHRLIMPFKSSPKFFGTCNHSIKKNGDSYFRRIEEFELDEYFSKSHLPVDEFGMLFFDEWETDEWFAFDNFMLECLRLYLAEGIIEAENINKEYKELLDVTNKEFIEYAMASLTVGEKYNKKELFSKFKTIYTDYEDTELKQNTFTKWLKAYIIYKGWDIADCPSNGVQYIIFIEKKEEKQKNKRSFVVEGKPKKAEVFSIEEHTGKTENEMSEPLKAVKDELQKKIENLKKLKPELREKVKEDICKWLLEVISLNKKLTYLNRQDIKMWHDELLDMPITDDNSLDRPA